MHALHCRRGLLTHRHNLIRDHVTAYAKSAGLLAQSEQRVLEDTPPSSQEPRPLARADLMISDLQHGDIYLDVRITTAPDPKGIDRHLAAQELLKVRSYNRDATVPDTVCAGLHPFVLESRGRAATAARNLASWLISKKTARLQDTKRISFAAARADAVASFWQPLNCILLRSWGQARETQREGDIPEAVADPPLH